MHEFKAGHSSHVFISRTFSLRIDVSLQARVVGKAPLAAAALTCTIHPVAVAFEDSPPSWRYRGWAPATNGAHMQHVDQSKCEVP